MSPAAATDVAMSSPAVTELLDVLERIVPKVQAEWGTDRSLPARLAWQRALADEGWAAPGWPVEHGGRGLGVRDRVACALELARAGVPHLGGILGLNNVGPALMAFGTPEQQASLPKILSTQELWCQGFSEPDAGSDLASLRTRAVLEGDEFVINGQKIWTSEGMDATHCLLLVRTDPAAAKHAGISALTVPMDTPGIERREIRQIDGQAGFAEVFFTDVRVPAGALLGPLNQGWSVTVTTLSHERAGVISMAAELEHNVREQLVDALRRLDGGSTEAGTGSARTTVLRERIARCYGDARIAGLLGMAALAQAERGGEEGAQQSLIKLVWSATTQSVAETLYDLDPGGGAFSPAAEQYLATRATTIAGGTTEILKSLAGERVLGLPRELRK